MAPSLSGFPISAQKTGVDWCELAVTSELLDLIRSIRSNEALIRVMEKPVHEQLVRNIVTDGVSAASVLAAEAQLDTHELFERCFALNGEPLDEARARRDMRERIRVFDRITSGGVALPETLDDVLDLWSEAMRGEVRLYDESEIAQFRRSRVPFAHRYNPFEYAVPLAGRETVEALRIPDETEALLAFMGRTDLPPEILASASHFLCGHIHPFSDGNGRLSRMLSCIQLASSYSLATVLSLLRRLQADRGTMNLAMARTVRAKGDLGEVVRLFLEMLRSANMIFCPKGGVSPTCPCASCGLRGLSSYQPAGRTARCTVCTMAAS